MNLTVLLELTDPQQCPINPIFPTLRLSSWRYRDVPTFAICRCGDIEVAGQIIPSHTMIFPVMTEILKGDHWGDGETFRPERQTLELHKRLNLLMLNF